MHGEVGSTNQVSIDATMSTLHAYITSYDLCNVHNIDETRLSYNMVPN